MSTWIVTNRATGEVVYAYTADEPYEFPGMEYTTYNHAMEVTVPPPAPSIRQAQPQ